VAEVLRSAPAWPDVTGEPTQVAPLDDDLIRAAIAAAETAEHRPSNQAAGRRSLPPAGDAARASLPGTRVSAPESEPRTSLPPRAASRPPASAPATPRPAPEATPPESRPRGEAAVLTTSENAALRGLVTLPKSMLSRDDLPPWFPKMPMRPEAAAPARSKLPVILFILGLVALVTAVLFVVLQG